MENQEISKTQFALFKHILKNTYINSPQKDIIGGIVLDFRYLNLEPKKGENSSTIKK